MSNARALAQDLRAHAHEVPEPIGRIMRAAAAELDRAGADDGTEILPPPFAPPTLEAQPCG